MAYTSLGIGVGVVANDIIANNQNTFSPYDFAFWCVQHISTDNPYYTDAEIDNDNAQLISWASARVGATGMPTDYVSIAKYCANYVIPISKALVTRGTLLFSKIDTDGTFDIAITLGLNDAIVDTNGVHTIKKLNALDLQNWSYATKIPKLVYK